MNRRDITNFLSKLLVEQRFSGMGKYWANEVTLDYGSEHPKRVDFMQFVPPSTMSVSGIEKGEFICYEVKSCMNDYKSGHGQNFIGERNYFVMPMSLYKSLCQGSLGINIGVMVPIPKGADKHEEFENPTELDDKLQWELIIVKNSYPKGRDYSLAELLFCMLRSGQDFRFLEDSQ